MREAIFNSLHSLGVVDGARVLDLFAGSGALGIEALSRGAAHCTFVEQARPALEAVRANLAATGLADRATVVVSEVVSWLARTRPDVDLAMADPPYAFDDWSDAPRRPPRRRRGARVGPPDRARPGLRWRPQQALRRYRGHTREAHEPFRGVSELAENRWYASCIRGASIPSTTGTST